MVLDGEGYRGKITENIHLRVKAVGESKDFFIPVTFTVVGEGDGPEIAQVQPAIVTARSAPAHERVVTTLRNWNIRVDQTFFLGGMDKGRILSILKPHIFFDDQRHPHLDSAKDYTPSVHIPFGICGQEK